MIHARRPIGTYTSAIVAAALCLGACGTSDGSADTGPGTSPSPTTSVVADTSPSATDAPGTSAGAPLPDGSILSWSDCGDGLECAEASVPLDYDEPSGEQITLALVRRLATDPQHRIGSLFVNDGGPGNSPVTFVRGDAADVLPPDVQARFDVIGFDPRGVGASTPIRCFPDSEEQAAFVGSHSGFPVGDEEFAAFTDASAEIGERCAATNGAILEHVSTANVARDLDALRAAVGDDQLSYAGYSYGGLLGVTYANLFPENVRVMLLDGVTDAGEWSRTDSVATDAPVSVRIGSPRATQAALESFLSLCQQAGDACSFGSDDVAARFDRLMERLELGPVTLVTPDGEMPITRSFVIDSLRSGLQFPPIWSFVADQLAAIDAAAFPGEATTPSTESGEDSPAGGDEPSTENGEDGGEEPSGQDGGEPAYDNSVESLLAVLCSETTNPSDPAAWQQFAQSADEASGIFGSDWAYISQPCATWPAHDADAYTGPYTATTANPVLFLNSRADAASDVDAAEEVAAAMPGSGFLVLEGPGHPASFVGNSCVTAAVSVYLIDMTLPAAGSTCANEAVPFG